MASIDNVSCIPLCRRVHSLPRYMPRAVRFWQAGRTSHHQRSRTFSQQLAMLYKACPLSMMHAASIANTIIAGLQRVRSIFCLVKGIHQWWDVDPLAINNLVLKMRCHCCRTNVRVATSVRSLVIRFAQKAIVRRPAPALQLLFVSDLLHWLTLGSEEDKECASECIVTCLPYFGDQLMREAVQPALEELVASARPRRKIWRSARRVLNAISAMDEIDRRATRHWSTVMCC